MKISELLREAAEKKSAKTDAKNTAPVKKSASALPRAASIDDAAVDSEDDAENGDEDDGAIADLKAKMGSMGGDLYSITAYNYDDEFSSIGPNKVVRRLLDAVDNPVVNDYWQYDNMDITNNKIVSAVILNDRNGEFITFYCGKDLNKFEPGVIQKLVQDGVIDSDQSSVLEALKSAGALYKRMVGRVEWKAGYEARNSSVYDALSGVIDALSLPQLPREQVISYHDVERRSDSDRDEARKKYQLWLKQKEEKKNAGPGREKR